MRYENTQTGAVVDSPFLIKGDNWIPVDNENEDVTDLSEQELKGLVLEQQKKINELEDIIDELEKTLEEKDADNVSETDNEVTSENEDVETEEVNLEELTNDQLEALAKDQNVKLTTADKKNKETRIAAIVAALG